MDAGTMNDLPPLPPGFSLETAAPDGLPPLPPGFRLETPAVGTPTAPSPITTDNLVRAAATGVPIIGGLLNKANAATYAAAEPVYSAVAPQTAQADTTISHAPSFSERYAENLAKEKVKDTKFATEHPIANTAAELTGGIAATAPVAATALGARALGLGGETLPGMITQGAASGAAIGGLDAAARDENPVEGLKTGGIIGAAAPVVGRGVGALVNHFIPANVPSVGQLGASALKALQDARKAGIEVSGQAMGRLGADIEASLINNNNAFRDYLAPKTFAAIREIASPPAGAVATLDDLHGMRRVLGKAAGDFSNPTEQAAASTAIRALDNYIANVPAADVVGGDPARAAKLFKDFLGDYAAKKRAELVGTKLEQAQLRAAGTHSGANVDNATRQKVLSILSNPKLSAQFTDAERDQMRRVVEGTATNNVLRWVGNLLGGGGGLGHMLTGAAGYMAAGPAGVAAPLAGIAARKAASAGTMRQARLLDELVRSRSTIGPTLPQPDRGAINRAAMVGTSLAGRGLLDPLLLPGYPGDQSNIPLPNIPLSIQ